MVKEKINALVDGGKATAGPPLGPKLGPLGINVGQLIADINKATADFQGIKVPVDLVIDTETKTWTITVGSPPTSQLLFKELKLAKGSGSAWREGNEEKPPIAGDVSKEIIIKIGKMKMEKMGTKTLKNAVKNVIGTCLSAGLTVEGKNPKEIQQEIESGSWDADLK